MRKFTGREIGLHKIIFHFKDNIKLDDSIYYPAILWQMPPVITLRNLLVLVRPGNVLTYKRFEFFFYVALYSDRNIEMGHSFFRTNLKKMFLALC